MIATRQRRKKGNWLALILVALAVVVIGIALAWTPARAVFMDGPLKPIGDVGSTLWNVVGRPLTFAYQQQAMADKNIEIARLNDLRESDRAQLADRDRRIAALQRQIDTLVARAATPAPGVSRAPLPSVAPSRALDQGALRLIAAQWAAMQPERAAAVAATLLPERVAAILAQMSPDAAGSILEHLPPKLAAQISLLTPSVQPSPAAGQ